MKVFVVLLLFVGLTFAADSLSSRFEGIDIDSILQNQRILTSYIRCLLGEGACTREGRELKKTLPDALKSGCSKCDGKTRETVGKVIHHLESKRPNDWARLLTKFDPKGEYKKVWAAQTTRRT